MKVLNQRIKSLWDNISSYCGDEDEWKMPVVATRQITIPKGTRIAQFRVQLSQMASPMQKLKWLFTGAPKLVKVDSLNNKNREGFGEGTKYLDK